MHLYVQTYVVLGARGLAFEKIENELGEAILAYTLAAP
jgi:hypothetical protein